MGKTPVHPNFIDKVVSVFDPKAGLERMKHRIHQNSLVESGYIATDTSRRSMRSANNKAKSSDMDDLPNIEKLRGLGRDLYRNSMVTTGAIDTMRFNVIGYGLTVQSHIDKDFLGLDAERARAIEVSMERYFNFWAKSDNADAEHGSNFYELQTIALIGSLVSGDIFAALPYIKREDSPFSLAVQLLEADMCSNPNRAKDNEKIAGGVEVDDWGAPAFYYFSETHPGAKQKASKWAKIPTFGESGRRNILHVMEKKRPGQRRGVSVLAPIIEPLKQLSDYTHAELTAAVVSGLFTVFIETEAGEGLQGVDSGEVEASNEVNLEAGAVIGLAEGEKVTTANPNRPNTAFDPFTQSIFKQIGAALSIPYEVLLKHFSSSYSASRAALLEAWKMFRTRRTWFAHKFTQPVYEALITEAVLLGYIDAPGFLEDPVMRAAYLGTTWNGPAQGQLNPVQETKAAKMKVEEGFSTRTKESSEMNNTDYDMNISRATSETESYKSSGLAVLSGKLKSEEVQK